MVLWLPPVKLLTVIGYREATLMSPRSMFSLSAVVLLHWPEPGQPFCQAVTGVAAADCAIELAGLTAPAALLQLPEPLSVKPGTPA